MIKRVEGSEFVVGKRTTAATKLADGDRVLVVEPAGNGQILLKSRDNYYLRFAMEEVPKQKKTAAGVRAIRLSGTDVLENVQQVEGSYGETVTIDGTVYSVSHFKLARRDGKGTKKSK